MRHIESPELFGHGVGYGTSAEISCKFCGHVYNQGMDEASRDAVRYTTFAGLVLCDCCFEAVEDEIERRMQVILRWYRVIVDQRRAELARDVKLLDDIGLERSWSHCI